MKFSGNPSARRTQVKCLAGSPSLQPLSNNDLEC
uniref:Uncharacterized protein n=1 Tax=Anguilla anguilla TaxID=7936 RepID=A0A0E9PCQ2_ANGAN